MKKFLLLSLAVAAASSAASAADGDIFSFQGLDYRVLSEADKTCEVAPNADKIEGAVVIPATVSRDADTFTVTALGQQAFFRDNKMTSISIPETVTIIRSQALMNIMNLTDLVIPNSVTHMDERACYGNWSLEHLTLSSSMREILHETFSGNAYLQEIIIPDGVEIIHNEAFNYCARVEKIELGSTVRSIGKMAFSGCRTFTEVTIPASVTELGDEVFSYCQKLSQVTFEASETPVSIGKDLLGQGLYVGTADDPKARVTVLNLNRPWTCSSAEINEMPFTKLNRLETVNIGSQLTAIPENSFTLCPNVTAVTVAAKECPQLPESAFDAGVYAAATLSVPEESVEAYKANLVWGKFSEIKGVEFPEPETPVDPDPPTPPTPPEPPTPPTPDAIETISADSPAVVAIYSLSGMKVSPSAAGPGIYIVRMTDGSVRKAAIR